MVRASHPLRRVAGGCCQPQALQERAVRLSPQPAHAFLKPGATRTQHSLFRGVGKPEERLDRLYLLLDGLSESRLSLSLLEVGRPLRVERMGLTDDLDVSSNLNFQKKYPPIISLYSVFAMTYS